MIAKILQGKAEEATSVVECLEVISGACQLVALQQDLDQVQTIIQINVTFCGRSYYVN